jgi:hypothetical protein
MEGCSPFLPAPAALTSVAVRQSTWSLCSTDGNAVPGTYSLIMTYPGTSASATATLTVTGTQTGAVESPAGARF